MGKKPPRPPYLGELVESLEAQIRTLTDERNAFRDEANALRRNYLDETKDLAQRADAAEAQIQRFQDGTLLGRHGREQADKIHTLTAERDDARACAAVLEEQQDDMEPKYIQLRAQLAALTPALRVLREAIIEMELAYALDHANVDHWEAYEASRNGVVAAARALLALIPEEPDSRTR